MLGLTRAELKRLGRMCGFLVVLMVSLTMFSDAFGVAHILTLFAAMAAVVGMIAGGALFIFGRPMILCISAMFVPMSIALGACIGTIITSLY